ncbi:MAG TPA: hypothetical protein VEL07_03850 [Planctomycetota bacterium]|nr:hypothetical protein [Planctomycetota bacterium]
MDSESTLRRRTIGGVGSGCFVVFGLLFSGFCSIPLYLLLTGGDVTVNGRPGRPGDAWLPALLVAGGLAITGFRSRRIVDLDERAIETTTGWLFWTTTKREAIGDWRSVEIRPPERRGSGKNRYTAIPVMLNGSHGAHEIDAPRHEHDARRLAEWLARGANLPLRDASAGDVVERAPDRLDEPLVARIRAEDLQAPEPERNRLRREDLMHGVRIRVPPSSALLLSPLMLLPLLIPLLFWWFLWRPGLARSADGSTASTLFLYAPLLMVVLPLVGMIVSALRGGTFGYRIDVDASGLRALRKDIPATELEELRVVSSGRFGGRCLRATSDRADLRLGAGLRDDELAWLRATILRALKG